MRNTHNLLPLQKAIDYEGGNAMETAYLRLRNGCSGCYE